MSKIMYVRFVVILCIMPSDNYSCPFVAIMSSGTANSAVGLETAVEIVRNMTMGPRTLMPWLIKVSHRVPVKWLGNLHGEKQVQDPSQGVLWLFWQGEGQKVSSRGLSVLATNVLKH